MIEHVAPGRVEQREVALAEPGAGEAWVQTDFSAISPGTESLVFRGEAPSDLDLDETIPSLRGGFTYPFVYGYAAVGRVVKVGSHSDEQWLGRRVFAFHPHQDYIRIRIEDCLPVPDEISSRAAPFLANTESAVNFVMDARPVLGERFLVIGLGVVGLVTTAILASFPLSRLFAADPVPHRREWARRFGATDVVEAAGHGRIGYAWADGGAARPGFDGVIELSGNADALDEAIAVTGFAGRIVIGSWYGRKRVALNLGGVFHRRRIRLISSQVSTLAPDLSGRWNKARRLVLAWEWIRRIEPERLITHVFSPSRCQEAFELAASPGSGALQVLFQFG